jgi:DNA-3-methyladenine glycosylase II
VETCDVETCDEELPVNFLCANIARAMESEAVKYLKSVDPVLERLIAKVGHVRVRPRRVPPFQSLIHAIAHQQLTGKAANTILKRFQALFGNGPFPAPDQILEMDLARLRSVGFSRAKATFVHDVAERARNGFIPSMAQCRKMTDAAIVERLTEIKGVGRWTAEMFLMFNLGRLDVLPIHDFGVRKGFQIAYKKRKLPEPEQLEKFGKKWSPHRTTAALYMYRAADFLKGDEW